jgi:hypothetical protein
MATFTKNKKTSALVDEIGLEINCIFSRKFGCYLNRLEQGEQLNIHRHEIDS